VALLVVAGIVLLIAALVSRQPAWSCRAAAPSGVTRPWTLMPLALIEAEMGTADASCSRRGDD
jgi:hypothetical protein